MMRARRDEATTALDYESEAEKQRKLTRIMENKTTLVIAHRLSTIIQMHRLTGIDKGSIKARGAHEDLVKTQGLYAKLWARQSARIATEIQQGA